MAVGVSPESILNNSLVQIPKEIWGRADFLITLLQAIGWLAIAYLVFNILSLLWSLRQKRDIRKILEIVEKIENKLKKKG